MEAKRKEEKSKTKEIKRVEQKKSRQEKEKEKEQEMRVPSVDMIMMAEMIAEMQKGEIDTLRNEMRERDLA